MEARLITTSRGPQRIRSQVAESGNRSSLDAGTGNLQLRGGNSKTVAAPRSRRAIQPDSRPPWRSTSCRIRPKPAPASGMPDSISMPLPVCLTAISTKPSREMAAMPTVPPEGLTQMAWRSKVWSTCLKHRQSAWMAGAPRTLLSKMNRFELKRTLHRSHDILNRFGGVELLPAEI